MIKYSEISNVLTKELTRSEVEQIVIAFKKKFSDLSSGFTHHSDIEGGLALKFDKNGCYTKCWDELKSSIPVLSRYEFV